MFEKLDSTAKVYADSIQAIDYLFSHGLTDRVEIRSLSPDVIKHFKDKNVISVEKAIDYSKRLHLLDLCSIASRKIYASLSNKLSHAEKSIISTSFVKRSGVLSKLVTLTEADFAEVRIITKIKTNNVELDKLYNFPWDYFLQENKKIQIIDIVSQCCDIVREENLGILNRIRNYKGYYLEYKLWESFWKNFSWLYSRGNIFFYKDNPLGQECALYFLRRGFRLGIINPNKRFLSDLVVDTLCFNESMQGIVREIFYAVFRQVLIEPVLYRFIDYFIEHIFSDVKKFNQTTAQLETYFNKNKVNKKSYVFSTFPSAELSYACNIKKLPLVSFHHGHECVLASQLLNPRHAFLEASLSDIVITYDEVSARRSQDNSYLKAKVKSLCIPKDYILRTKCRRKVKYDVTFVSTYLPTRWDCALLQLMKSNVERSNFEALLITHVFSKIDKKILYKPYPSPSSYIDSTYLKDKIESYCNISYYKEHLNLKYIVPYTKMLISCRATSTMGWCIMANIPFVFIDIRDELPVHDELRKDLIGSVFYFDSTQDNFINDLLGLLQKDFDEIDQLWSAMSNKRKNILSRHFTTDLKLSRRKYGKVIEGELNDC